MNAPATENRRPAEFLPLDSSGGLADFAPESWDVASLPLRDATGPAPASMRPEMILGLHDQTAPSPVGRIGLAVGVVLLALALVVLGAIVWRTPEVDVQTSRAVPRTPAIVTPPSPPSSPVEAAPPPASVVDTHVPEPADVAPQASSLAPPEVAPPAVAAPAVAAVPSRPLSDQRAIEMVLDRYRQTFNALDAKTVNRIEDESVAFDGCEVQIGGGDAKATCRGTARYVPVAGSDRTPRVEGKVWRFDLRQQNAREWVITQVETR